MTHIAYVHKRFSRKSVDTINKANDIIEAYQAQGFTLTLRQLYYQFVSRDLIPNKQSEYKKLGATINNARLAGLVSWDALEDRTRNLRKFYFSDLKQPEDVLEDAAQSHEVDRWQDQKNYVEVWIEKDALVGVIERVCSKWRVPYFACRGYNSQSEQWNAGIRFAEKIDEGKKVHVLHLGDHDPSGIDMTHDNQSRLSMFAAEPFSDDKVDVNVTRLALNMDQVRKYNPPPNPAKDTDARFDGYVKKYGKSCWELDALEPKVIASIVNDNINKLVNNKVWSASGEREEEDRKKFYDAIARLKGN